MDEDHYYPEGYPLLGLQLFELVSIYLEKSQNLMNELIMSVKGLAIYSGAGYKNLDRIRSGLSMCQIVGALTHAKPHGM